MSVQSGGHGTGYDPSLTVAEQITQTQARITALLNKSREGSHAIEAARAQLARLQAQQSNVAASVAASKATLVSHAAHNTGSVSARYVDDGKTE